MGAEANARRLAGKRGAAWPRILGVSLLALALPGCAAMAGQRLAPGEARTLTGPAVRDNRTPMDGVLQCFAGHMAARGDRPLVIAVGDVRDYTGKYSVNEGNAITQGGALMVASALGKLQGQVRIAERFDPTIGERELGYTDRRQLGDGNVHALPGPAGAQSVSWLPYFGGSIQASDYYIVGGITELNYDIRSGGAEFAVGNVGPKHRTYTQSVAIDLRIVDTRSLVVMRTISLTKQFTGYETGFGIFRFFGSSLFDVNIGAKGQEPLQLGIRTALEEATMRLVGAVSKVDPAPCMSQASWAAAPVAASAAPLAEARGVLSRNAAALNGPAPIPSRSSEVVAIAFDVGSSELGGSAPALLDRIVTVSSTGVITLTIVGRDTENLDPAKREALTDRRIAAIMAALRQRGIAPAAVTIDWRPVATDPSIIPDSPGLQRLARLRIGT
ncbi:CsgG/HfaB family protein [Sphingobium sp. B2]|uniref:CsgG/HfaB family protein n=1 Tax=Sphingobium sp. B2 TaxID=2583228 RepID=UPI0011A8A9C5|nr:CsgG/HfaB family protein [Sphingobium sp. B2]